MNCQSHAFFNELSMTQVPADTEGSSRDHAAFREGMIASLQEYGAYPGLFRVRDDQGWDNVFFVKSKRMHV